MQTPYKIALDLRSGKNRVDSFLPTPKCNSEMRERERRLVRDIRTGGDKKSYNHLLLIKVAENQRVLTLRMIHGTWIGDWSPLQTRHKSSHQHGRGQQCWQGWLAGVPLTSVWGKLRLFAWALGDDIPCPSPRLTSGTESVSTHVLL